MNAEYVKELLKEKNIKFLLVYKTIRAVVIYTTALINIHSVEANIIF